MDRDAWDARYAEAEHLGHLWGAEPNRFVVEVVEGLHPGRALDLGCGEGRNARWLSAGGWRVCAVDFSPVAIERARAAAAATGLGPDVLEFVEADVCTWEPPAGAFDLVLLAYLHLPAPQRTSVLDRAAAALAAGGTLCLVGHDVVNLTEGYGGPQDPSVLCGVEEVATAVTDTGLFVRLAERRIREVDTPDGPRRAVDHVVVATRPEGADVEPKA